MRTVAFRTLAASDIEEIAAYTELTWGTAQRHGYLDQLRRVIERLRATPSLGRTRAELGPGYRSLPVEHHVVYYVAIEDMIEIVRVLHKSMDSRRHL